MELTARDKRAIKRYVKGFLASVLGALAYMMANNVPLTVDNIKAYAFIPALTALFLALEKGLQKEKTPPGN